jgi:hypothetical protein
LLAANLILIVMVEASVLTVVSTTLGVAAAFLRRYSV